MTIKLRYFMDIDQLFARFDLPKDFTNGLDKVYLYDKFFPKEGFTISVRPVSLKKDISLMHRWATHPQAQKYWQMDYSKQDLYRYYLDLLQQKLAFAFLVYLNRIPVAQTDVYQAIRDEVAGCYKASANDYGIHLLMAPYKEIKAQTELKLNNLSACVLITMLGFLFSYDSVHRIIAEPDSENMAANKLAEKVGYRFMKIITLSYKTAKLYHFDKRDFLKIYP